MSGISDPGLILIDKAKANNIEIIPIPGTTALISGLVVSGIPTGRFTFYGFIPRKRKDRADFIEQIGKSEETIIFCESLIKLKRYMRIYQNKYQKEILL